jgi:hypothetical protein
MKVTLLSTLVATGLALAAFSGAAKQKVVWWSTAARPTKCVKPKHRPSAKNTM